MSIPTNLAELLDDHPLEVFLAKVEEEIARLRSELSRAAVREGEKTGTLEAYLLTTDLAVVKCKCGAWGERQPDLEHFDDCPLAPSSPLAEAAQEVLEAYPPALGLLLNFKHFCEHETGDHCNDPDAECPIAMGEWWESEERETFERAMTAHKRFRALLEGREED